MLSGFAYGRTQHVRGMRSSIVSVRILELPTGWFNIYHLLFLNYDSFSSADCLFHALIASVRGTKEFLGFNILHIVNL